MMTLHVLLYRNTVGYPASLDDRPKHARPSNGAPPPPGWQSMTQAEYDQRLVDTLPAWLAFVATRPPRSTPATVLVASNGSRWVINPAGTLVRA